MTTLVSISFFGLLGVLSRFAIDRWFVDFNAEFPVTTFVINIIGCALAGCVYVVSERGIFSSHIQLGLIVGFCGGFTTFSAYALQTMSMLERGRVVPALVYLTVSPILGLAAAYMPVALAKRML